MKSPAPAGPPPGSVAARLFSEGFAFDFFQAVRLLEQAARDRVPVGREGPAAKEAVRFRAHVSLAFPASSIYEIKPAGPGTGPPSMAVTFLGLVGTSGVLPRHYTEFLLGYERQSREPEKQAFRAFLDLFHHRLIALFYRAWEKYRFTIAFARGDHFRPETFSVPGQDPFTRALFSLVGLGTPALRNQLRVSAWDHFEAKEHVLAQVPDPVVLFYGGLFAQRPRNALNLQALLTNHFKVPVEVKQFQGQWLPLPLANQASLEDEGNNHLGFNVVAGERVWDIRSLIRLRIGPLSYARFLTFLPDPEPGPEHKGFYRLCHLARLFVGPELDFEVQLVLKARDIPECALTEESDGFGPRLGWNTWIYADPQATDAEDAVFVGEAQRWLGEPPEAGAQGW